MVPTRPHPVPDTLGVRVVRALAAAHDTGPLDVEPPLYETIDPGALDRLFRSGGEGRVTFEYEGRPVEVRADGTVSVDGAIYDEE